jgi:pimeloyl-ACP methyl ester carboxylesterase
MVPIEFNGCFGWFHPGTADYGVVLCGPEGHEELCVHHIWLNFAEELAAAGFPTLRFDYFGTGDSTGDDEDPGWVGAWSESVAAAVNWMKDQAGIKTVALVGLRLGATLAVAVANELRNIDRLVLLAPVLSGTAYVRELRLRMEFDREREAWPWPERENRENRENREKNVWRGGLDPEEGIESVGFVYTAKSLADLKKMTLLDVTGPPAPRILMLKRGLSLEDRVANQYRQLGAVVSEEKFLGYTALMQPPYLVKYPHAAFEYVISWLKEALPYRKTVNGTFPPPVQIKLPDCVEEPVFFGNHSSLFGVICRPTSVRLDAPVLLFLTTWWNPHVGSGRMWVTMARDFARLGYPSLRFDVAGVGDSLSKQNSPSDSMRLENAIGDVRAAMDCLQSKGHRRFVLIGLCWGATLALAVSLKDDRVSNQVLINLPSTLDGLHTLRRYLSLARNPNYWWHILRGEIGVSFIFKRLSSVADRLRRAYRRGEGLPGIMALLQRVNMLLVFCAEEPGLQDFQQLKSIEKYTNVQIEIFENADHSFYQRSARHRLTALIADYLANSMSLRHKANKEMKSIGLPPVANYVTDSEQVKRLIQHGASSVARPGQ